jgi:hypothetical protein
VKLVNVRLDPEHARLAADLQAEGIELSALVRRAIRDAHRTNIAARRDAAVIDDVLQRIYDELPDPATLPERDVDVRDRAAVRHAVGRRARRQRR